MEGKVFGEKPKMETDETALRFLKLEDNSSQHCPRQIDVTDAPGAERSLLDFFFFVLLFLLKSKDVFGEYKSRQHCPRQSMDATEAPDAV